MAKPQVRSNKFANFKRVLGPTGAWLFPLIALVVKIITIANIPGHIWLGADGESYLDGVNGLLESGVASDREKLQYFPAGYPIIIWLLSKISLSNALLLLSLFQSIVFACACWYFTKELNQTRFKKYITWVSFLISFNPTLALSSMVIGYESLVASFILVSISVILTIKKDNKNLYLRIFSFSLVNGLMAFLQPRYLATTLIIALVWFFIEFDKKRAFKYLIIVFLILISLL